MGHQLTMSMQSNLWTVDVRAWRTRTAQARLRTFHEPRDEGVDVSALRRGREAQSLSVSWFKLRPGAVVRHFEGGQPAAGQGLPRSFAL